MERFRFLRRGNLISIFDCALGRVLGNKPIFCNDSIARAYDAKLMIFNNHTLVCGMY